MDIIFALGFFLFGLLFGSFLNVCIHRIPRQESVVFPSSACPACHNQIRPYDNIPVISWLLLRGRCRHCQTPITPRYASVELITGFLFLACYSQWGLSLSTLKYCIFCFLITGLVFIDAEWKLLPDGLTLPGLLIGFIFSWFVPLDPLLSDTVWNFFGPTGMSDWSWRLLSFCDSVLGAAVGAAFIFGVGFVYFHLRGVEGMGFGDVKLMAMIGAFFGVKLTVFTIFAASIAGTVFGLTVIIGVWLRRTRRRIARFREAPKLARKRAWRSAKLVYRFYQMPFGVFLGSMALASLFFGDQILRWYWRFFW